MSKWGFKPSPDDEVKLVWRFQIVTILIVNHPNLVHTTLIVNVGTTLILNTAATPKHHTDDIETHIKSLEDKLLSKIAALKSHFFNDIFDLRNDITLLKENSEKEKPADSNNKKNEVRDNKTPKKDIVITGGSMI